MESREIINQYEYEYQEKTTLRAVVSPSDATFVGVASAGETLCMRTQNAPEIPQQCYVGF